MPRSDVLVRDVRVDDFRALVHILITANETAFRGRVLDRCLEFIAAVSAANWRSTLLDGLPPGDVFVVAEQPGGAPMGYAWGGPCEDPHYRGELRQIAVLPSEQGKGIGRLLVSQVTGRLAAQGIHSLRVEVLRVNPNLQF